MRLLLLSILLATQPVSRVETRIAPVKVYVIEVTPETRHLLDVRVRMQHLLNQTFEDDVAGRLDLQKYREIRRLALELPETSSHT